MLVCQSVSESILVDFSDVDLAREDTDDYDDLDDKSYLVIKAKEVRIGKEVKRSDGL